MRRLGLLVDQCRRAAELENPSTTDNISDLEIVQYFNDAQDRILARLTAEHPRFFLSEGFVSFVASQESYSLPADIYLGTKILSVEYKYGTDATDYYKLYPASFHERYTDFESPYPAHYIRKGSTILINPIPSVARTNALRITYQKKLYTLDIRRGVITSASKTGSTLNSLTLDLTPTLVKDDGTVQAAADLLTKADYICVVDKDGTSIVDTIPITGYNSTTGVITCDTFTTTVDAADFAEQYVVAGSLATTHSELPDICERYLLSYATFKLLRRNANSLELEEQRRELAAIEGDIVDVFKNPDDDIFYLRLDEMWDDYG